MNWFRRDDGFSTLEALIAFAILALSLGALMQVASVSLQAHQKSADMEEADNIARRVLAETLERPAEELRAAYERSGENWRISATPVKASQLMSFEVTVTLPSVTRSYTLIQEARAGGE